MEVNPLLIDMEEWSQSTLSLTAPRGHAAPSKILILVLIIAFRVTLHLAARGPRAARRFQPLDFALPLIFFIVMPLVALPLTR